MANFYNQNKEENMFHFKTFGFIVLLGCFIPLRGMDYEMGRKNKLLCELDADAIVPTIEATVMTTLATLPQAMLYVPLNEAAVFAISSGVTIGFFSAVGYALPSMLSNRLVGTDKHDCADKNHVIEWRKPLYVSFALLTTCLMLYFNQRELAYNFGI